MRVACAALVCMTLQLRQRGGGMMLLDCDEGELEQGDGVVAVAGALLLCGLRAQFRSAKLTFTL